MPVTNKEKVAALFTAAQENLNQYILKFEILLSPLPAFVSNGIVPLLILFLLLTVFYRFYLKPIKLNKEELVQAAFVFILTAFIILTLTGIFFRGKDMELTFPWNI